MSIDQIVWYYSIAGRITFIVAMLLGLYFLVKPQEGTNFLVESLLKIILAFGISLLLAGCILSFFI